jgi:hypothetical protein
MFVDEVTESVSTGVNVVCKVQWIGWHAAAAAAAAAACMPFLVGMLLRFTGKAVLQQYAAIIILLHCSNAPYYVTLIKQK